MVTVSIIDEYVVIGTLCGHTGELQRDIHLAPVLNLGLDQPLAVTVF